MRVPACARGPSDSGHPRRRAVRRCDRQNLPELTLPLAGPLSPLVSRAALFFPAGSLHWGKDLGEEGEEVRGLFELSATQRNSGVRVDLSGLI